VLDPRDDDSRSRAGGGLLDAVWDRHGRLDVLINNAGASSRRRRSNPLNAERLVTACVALGLLVRDREGLRNAPDVERFLVGGRTEYAGSWILFTKPDWQDWGRLAEHLGRSEPPSVLGKYAGFTVDAARRYHQATYSIGMGAARRFVRQVDLSRRHGLLDLGGGSGCYCIVAAQRHPQLTAVVLDLSPVVEVVREFIAAHGLSDRVSATACDFTRDPPSRRRGRRGHGEEPAALQPRDHPPGARAGARCARPGGEMHLIGEMLATDHSGPVDPALWGLSEAIANSTGLAHSVVNCVDYLEHGGFTGVAAYEFVPGVLVRVSGTKPATTISRRR
jgi:hypothetical protein